MKPIAEVMPGPFSHVINIKKKRESEKTSNCPAKLSYIDLSAQMLQQLSFIWCKNSAYR